MYEGNLLPRHEYPGGHAKGIQSPGGRILRLDTTGEHVTIVASGQRNAYDLAFHPNGELFTEDSDMESEEGTPWYRQKKYLHVVNGTKFGQRSGWASYGPNFMLIVFQPSYQ